MLGDPRLNTECRSKIQSRNLDGSRTRGAGGREPESKAAREKKSQRTSYSEYRRARELDYREPENQRTRKLTHYIAGEPKSQGFIESESQRAIEPVSKRPRTPESQ